jgi:alpha-tubulin suppressor-like RCC1 family protein
MISPLLCQVAGGDHSMALKNDGTVVVWGSDRFGQRDGKPYGLIARVP